jgi:hypothetical protein
MRSLLVAVMVVTSMSSAIAAPVEPCPVAKSCSQAYNICKTNSSNSNCDAVLSDCKATGVVRGNYTTCTVPSSK